MVTDRRSATTPGGEDGHGSQIRDNSGGEILLRLIPTAAHSIEDVNYTVQHFKTVQEKLTSGAYKGEKVATF